jgi:quercetin dioxygenase-like cupin family protein
MMPPLPQPLDDLAGEELRDLAIRIGARPELWRKHVRHDAAQRTFARVISDDNVSVWLICWMPGQDTGFHDHDGSAGAVLVLEGEIEEQRMRLFDGPATAVYGRGELLEFGPADIHRVRHHGDAPAVTLHAYSPRLRRMGAYVESDDGRLLRHALDEDEELRASAA